MCIDTMALSLWETQQIPDSYLVGTTELIVLFKFVYIEVNSVQV